MFPAICYIWFLNGLQMKKLAIVILFLTAQASFAQKSADERVWRTTEVDQKPQLDGGMYSLSAFILNNFKFPEIANKKIKIFASFIVEKNGTMTDVKTYYLAMNDLEPTAGIEIETTADKDRAEKVSEAMKAETLRVLTAFKERWTPAKKGGMDVRCIYNYPISFNVE